MLSEREEGLSLPWPEPAVGVGFPFFAKSTDWRLFIERFNLHPGVPLIVSLKYARAQKLYYFAWVDFDIIKAGELLALIALELALKDRYSQKADLFEVSLLCKSKCRKMSKKKAKTDFAVLCCYLAERDGMNDSDIPLIRRCGGSIIKRLTGEVSPSIAEIRNSLAHGDPFDGFPQAGLIEIVRDLLHYVYRDAIAQYDRNFCL